VGDAVVGEADGVRVGVELGVTVDGELEGVLDGLRVVGDEVGFPVGLRFGGYSRINSFRKSLTNIFSAISKGSRHENSTMVARR